MISVYPLGGELFAFAETPFIHRIDPITLETTGRVIILNDENYQYCKKKFYDLRKT